MRQGGVSLGFRRSDAFRRILPAPPTRRLLFSLIEAPCRSCLCNSLKEILPLLSLSMVAKIESRCSRGTSYPRLLTASRNSLAPISPEPSASNFLKKSITRVEDLERASRKAKRETLHENGARTGQIKLIEYDVANVRWCVYAEHGNC